MKCFWFYYLFLLHVLEGLQGIEEAEAHDYRLHLTGELIRRSRRTQYHNRDISIADNLSLLQESRISLKEFLLLSSIYFAPVGAGVRVSLGFSISYKNFKARGLIFCSSCIYSMPMLKEDVESDAGEIELSFRPRLALHIIIIFNL